MRRGGWKVRMAADCCGSWEESPPSLIDVAIRDRRWAQGNLQHMKIIAPRAELHQPAALGHRHHELSVLAAVAVHARRGLRPGRAVALDPAGIFQPRLSTVPTWPRFDIELMMTLFWFSMVVLLIRRCWVSSGRCCSRRIRRGCGGVIGVVASVFLETILSALYAPILMLVQSRHVFEVFMGRDSGWKPQRRDGGGTSWGDAWSFHKRHLLLSCMTAAVVYVLSPSLLPGCRRRSSDCFSPCRCRAPAAASP